MSPRSRPVDQTKYVIRSASRALQLLRLFLDDDGELTLTQIGNRVGLTQSTTYRLIATLIEQDFVEQNPETGKYRLGTTCLALGEAYLQTRDLRRFAQPGMRRLRDETGETIHLGIFDGESIVYLDKLEGLHPIGLMASRIGGRAPAYCTAIGKALLSGMPTEELDLVLPKLAFKAFTANTITNAEALLSELDEIRSRGHAVDAEEHEEGVVCVAAPIFDHKSVVGAISASGPAKRIYEEISRDALAEKIRQEAAVISRVMGAGI